MKSYLYFGIKLEKRVLFVKLKRHLEKAKNTQKINKKRKSHKIIIKN